jgi:WD40 repeat protein
VAGGGAEYGRSENKADAPFLVMLDAGAGTDACPLRIARNSVASVAFSKDGKVLAAGMGNTLRLWHGTTGNERTLGDGHENWISAIAIAEDGRSAVTAGGDGMLIHWDLTTGREKRRIQGHESEVRAAAFVPGGKLLVSAGTDQTVRLWNVAGGTQERRLKAESPGLLYAVAVSADGKLLAAGDYSNGAMYIWELGTFQLLHRLQINQQQGFGVMRLAFSPDCKTLAVGESVLNARVGPKHKGQIYLWDASSGRKLREFPAHAYAVDSLTFSADGTMLASTGWSDKTIEVWDVPSGVKLFAMPCGTARGAAVFSPDGKTLALGGSPESGVELWEFASRNLRRRFTGHSAHHNALAFAPDGRTLLSGGMDTTGLVWDVSGLRTTAKPATPLALDRLGALWTDLASPDAARADRAIWVLVSTPRQAVPFLAERLRDLPSAKPGNLQALVADLGSDDFEARQAAQQSLESLGKRAEPALRKALGEGPSLEMRRRIESVLEKRETVAATPDVLQVLRGLEALENIGTPEANATLLQLGKQMSEDYYKQEAGAAAQRLARRIAKATPQ